MNRLWVVSVALAYLSVATGCECSKDTSEHTSTAVPEAGASSPADEQVAAFGTLKVLGKGTDLYHVFDGTGENKINFTRTGKPLEVPAGPCLVILNGTRKQAVVEPGKQTELQTGVLRVAGTGQDLYEVYEGAHKLNFTRTNGELELFEGSYVVRLNNSSQQISVRAGEETVVAAGSIMVAGDGKALYEVYDEGGTDKFGFTSTGRAMELLPGTYTVVCQQKTYPAAVKAKEQTTITPQ